MKKEDVWLCLLPAAVCSNARWQMTLFSGAQWQDKGQWAQTEAREVPSEHEEELLPSEDWQSTGTGCPGRLWSLFLWRYSRPAWTTSCAACCRWPCFSREVGLDDPQRSLPTPTILWFCEQKEPANTKNFLLRHGQSSLSSGPLPDITLYLQVVTSSTQTHNANFFATKTPCLVHFLFT